MTGRDPPTRPLAGPPGAGWRERGVEWLASRRVVAWAAALGVALTTPALRQGFQLDDHFHRVHFDPTPVLPELARPWHGIFDFFVGDPAYTRKLVETGLAPWWADPELRVRFLRPVAALTHYLDWLLWPEQPALMHAVSIAWYGALCASAAVLYRQLARHGDLGARVGCAAAGAAALAYAADPAHGVVAAWISNRNGLLGGTFTFLALALHDRARERASGRLGVGAAVVLGVGLLSSELAVGGVALLAAYALTLDQAPWRARLVSLLPAVAVVAGWAIAHRLGGYGSSGSGLYTDPLGEPGTFLAQLPERFALLAATGLGAPFPDLLVALPELRSTWLTIAALVLVVATYVLIPRLRVSRVARFHALGAALAILPGCAVFASARVLVVAGFCQLGLLVELIAALWSGSHVPASGLARRMTRIFAGWNAIGRALVAVPLMVGILGQVQTIEERVDRWSAAVGDAPEVATQHVLLVHAPDAFFPGYIVIKRALEGQRLPARLRVLGVGTHELHLSRVDPRTLDLEVPGGVYQNGTDLLMRSPSRPLPVGTRLELDGVTLEILATTPRGVPLRVRATFDVELESPRLRWLRWDGDTLVEWRPPAPGGRETLPALSHWRGGG